ncbi:hypothetical protein [Bifidobacterium sp. ESL0819]|uniref:hypothetical protein n=1 Tax=Bifidobacterium sp. ESL0819 TaxID=3448589 RepID=UPI0040418782
MIEFEFAYTQKFLYEIKEIGKQQFGLSWLYQMLDDVADYNLNSLSEDIETTNWSILVQI